MSIIALLTDYGLKDHYVGTIKGVIKTINPKVEIIDISHNIELGNVLAANFLLVQSFKFFPINTIFISIVDPDVGSKCEPILIQTKNYYFIGRNNGVFSQVLENEIIEKIIVLDNDNYFLKPISNTFHGRDIFAPIAAYLSKGINPKEFGKEINSNYLFNLPLPKPLIKEDVIEGNIIYVDSFGNLITNIHKNILKNELSKYIIKINNIEIKGICSTFSDVRAKDIVCYIGSSQYLEIASNFDNLDKKNPDLKNQKIIVIYKVD